MNNVYLFVLFWIVVILYTAQGGLKAVISTDIVQAAFFSIIFLLCFGFVLAFEPTVSVMQMPGLENFANVSSKLCGWLFMPLLFMVIEQDMGQRCFAGASARTVSLASLLAGVCTMIICVVPVFFGSLAQATGLEVPVGSSALMAMVAQATNPWITALVGCAILAAIISTATSLINAISSNLSSDFQFSFLQNIDSMKFVRGITCIISVVAIFFAFYFDNVVDLLIQSYELSVSSLFVPLIMALFKRQGHLLSAWSAILWGAMGFVLFRIYPVDFPREILSLLLSMLGYSFGEMVSRGRLKMA